MGLISTSLMVQYSHLFLLLFLSLSYAKDCFEVIEDHGLESHPESAGQRVSSLAECKALCSQQNCAELVFSLNGECHILSDNTRALLVSRIGDVFAFKNPDCIADAETEGLFGSILKRLRRAVDSWGSWGACSVTCGIGNQKRSRGSDVETKRCSFGPCMQWQPWNGWTSCSASCGDGVRTRTRFCPNYYGCGPISDNTQTENCIIKPCGGNWLPWNGWSACSALCGGGLQSRKRDCSSYGCQGESVQDQPCNPQSCCAPWSKFGKCSVSCGEGGTEQRSRRCTIEDKSVPTGYASKEETESRACIDVPPCATWSTWGEWGECNVQCGVGEKKRERVCSIPGLCPGLGEDFERCDKGACTEWRDWSAWSRCDATCGGGEKVRQRVCTQEGSCLGDPIDAQPCANFPCPEWTNWGPWSFCSESCGGGWQKRGRVCNMYNLCAGDNKEKQLCNIHECPKPGDWGQWSECSQPCGGNGYQLRERVCGADAEFCARPENADAPSCFCDDAGEMQQAQPCNAHECATWAPWQPWGTCTQPCGGGQRRKERRCANDPDFCVGPNKDHPSCVCEAGETEIVENCNEHVCPQWSSWREWGECSVECGGGAMERKRTCERDESYCAGKDPKDPSCVCPGLDHSNDQCNVHPCPTWARWGRWGSCSASCAGGVRTRKRNCRADPTFCTPDKLESSSCACTGEPEESDECNTHECATWIKWSHWGECSKSCEGGVQTRKRNCNKDFSFCFGTRLFTDPSCICEGEEDGEQTCNKHMCPSWITWQPWQPCSASCSGGSRVRTRDCNLDPVYCTGAKMGTDPACMCPGPEEQSGQCNQVSCPTWTDWKDWSGCSASCGTGVQKRTRDCSLDVRFCKGDNMNLPECQCPEDATSTQSCDAGACHVWAVWQEWSSCTAVCGGGSRNRSRECPVVGGCPGLDHETDFCNQVKCPDWGDWSPWSDCSATCGGGRRAKTRSCAISGGCKPGEPLTLEPCNEQNCPIWSQWGEWSSCSRSCGEGKRERSRDCTPIDGCLGGGRQSEPCSETNCELATYWSEWSPCSTTCGGGLKTRARVPCVTCAVEEEMSQCESHDCPTWASWHEWATCSQTCGGGFRLRGRECQYQNGTEVPKGCIGRGQEIDANPCNDFSC